MNIWRFASDAGEAPFVACAVSFESVGQPVSAMYILGLFASSEAGCTFVSWKKFVVHEEASLMDT